MSSKSTKHTKLAVTHKKKIVTFAFIVIIALVVVDLSPLGGNIRFYTKWVECGQKPIVAVGSGLFNEGGMYYEKAPTLQPVLRNPSIYCAPIEAERDGYSATEDRYDFPNLKAAGEPTPFDKKIQEMRDKNQNPISGS